MKKYLSLLVAGFSIYSFSQQLVAGNTSLSNFNLENNISAALSKNELSDKDTMLKNTQEKIVDQNVLNKTKASAKIVDVAHNYESTASKNIITNYFPTTEKNLTIGMDATNWQDLNVSSIINVANPLNINIVNVDGFSQINNNKPSNYQFAIGIFVDGKLKLMKKFIADSKADNCSSKEFNVEGVLENLPVGEHEVKVYAYNFPKLSDSYSSITYGGNASGCSKTNQEKSNINLSVQVSE